MRIGEIVCWGVCLLILTTALSGVALGLAESTAADGCNAQAVHALGCTGAGINVALISGGNAQFDHEAFVDHAGYATDAVSYYNVNGLLYSKSGHDTRAAGVICSRGGVYPNDPCDIGVAPGCHVYSSRISSYTDMPKALEDLIIDPELNLNCRVVVSVINYTSEVPNGDSYWTMLYDYYAYEYNVVVANAAGNSGIVTVWGDGYNGITTGGLIVTDPDVYRRVGTLTGSGPTDDDRRKPDITAPVQNQTMPDCDTSDANDLWNSQDTAGTQAWTSFAAPHTAGVAALLLEWAGSSGDPDASRHEVIKAVIINAAFRNIYDKDGVSTAGAVYDFDRGYGRIDALRAFNTLSAGALPRDTQNGQQSGWAYADEYEFPTLGTHTYYVYAPRGGRLLATLAWDRIVTRDKRGNLSADFADLDLVVFGPSGGNAIFDGLNAIDNVEKCDFIAQESGYYEVRIVNHSNAVACGYGLAFEVLPALAGDLNADYYTDYIDLAMLASDWLDPYNLSDFAVMASGWLHVDPRYHD